ncbi:hypothetical protein [uncultured Mediterranean phage uvMED]|nr:hypothetical protein [uncultured Mediterranean phage uvMED]
MKYFQFERVKYFIEVFDLREEKSDLYINNVKSIFDLDMQIRKNNVGDSFKEISYNKYLSTFKFNYKGRKFIYECKFEDSYVKLKSIK